MVAYWPNWLQSEGHVSVIAIIPARLGSSRFPGKPLSLIDGIPMVGHVWYRAKMSSSLDEVYVATCDHEIFNYIQEIGGKPIMTSSTHERCTDRTCEALKKIESVMGKKVDIVVMIQGDEPLLTPRSIDEAVKPLLDDKNVLVSNLMNKIVDENEIKDHNEIKVVVNKDLNAMYMSREPIPTLSRGVKKSWYKQVCIIPFQRNFLLEYSSMAMTPLEKTESIDMLRVIENGLNVKMVLTEDLFYSVDTEEDRARVEILMKQDHWRSKYERN